MTYEPGAVGLRHPGRLRRRIALVLTDHAFDVLLGVVLAVFAIVLLVDVPKDYSVDSWLALVVGREVWQSGIPHENLLTLTGYGHRWIDEQWLSQLASYAVFRLGGLGLLGVLNVALMVGPVAAAITIARRRGAAFGSVLVAIAPCVILISPSREIRTQEFAMPLFVAVVWLLSSDARARARDRRVYWCVPILALWANLHGSATLGAGLVVLYALTVLWDRRGRLRGDARAWRRPALLSAGAALALLATPYGLSVIGYYHSTMVDPDLRQYVTEWKPITTSSILTVAWLVLCGLAVWSSGRSPSRTTTWEKLALLIVAVGALDVMRNALFLTLLGLMVLPVALGLTPASGTSGSTGQETVRSRVRVNGACAAVVAIVLLVVLVGTLTRSPASILYARQSPGLVPAVRRATTAEPSLHLIADGQFSDFLLWEDPQLSGRVQADVRFELLSGAQLAAQNDVFLDSGSDPESFARGDRLVVLSRAIEPAGVAAFLAEPGSRVLWRGDGDLLVLRTAAQANRS